MTFASDYDIEIGKAAGFQSNKIRDDFYELVHARRYGQIIYGVPVRLQAIRPTIGWGHNYNEETLYRHHMPRFSNNLKAAYLLHIPNHYLVVCTNPERINEGWAEFLRREEMQWHIYSIMNDSPSRPLPRAICEAFRRIKYNEYANIDSNTNE